jgi:hypothetical protein
VWKAGGWVYALFAKVVVIHDSFGDGKLIILGTRPAPNGMHAIAVP